MGDLFWNKIFGVLLALFLFIMALGVVVDMVFSEDDHDGDDEAVYGYPVDLSALESTGAEEVEVEGPVDFGALLLTADIAAGERVARRCTSCHAFDQGGGNGTGPALWDVMGRAVASVGGFGYSGAFQDYAADGSAWDYENMYNFLENPRQYISGTAMSFAGLRNQEDRINIIAYMRAQASNPIALPDPLPVESEVIDASIEEDGEPLIADEDLVEAIDEETEEASDEIMAPVGEAPEPATETVIDDAATTVEAVVEDVTEAVEEASDDLPTITEVDQVNAEDEDDVDGEESEEPGR